MHSSLRSSEKIRLLQRVPHRDDLPNVMEILNFTAGAELGVYDGGNALNIMKKWKSCSRFILVDLWAHQDENYHDTSNHEQSQHNANLELTKKRMANYSNQVIFIQNYTTKAALQVDDESLDFIYVDARHDYCGVRDDIQSWWPKLKQGGVMAGHDYMTATDRRRYAKDDWGICYDGSRNDGAVKGAVLDFAKANSLEVYTTKMDYPYSSWIFSPKGLVRKPSFSATSSYARPKAAADGIAGAEELAASGGGVKERLKNHLRSQRVGQRFGPS